MGQHWRLGAQAPLTGAWPGLRIISHGAEMCKKDVLNILLAEFLSLKLTLMSKHWINWSMFIWLQKFLMTSLIITVNVEALFIAGCCCIYCWLYQQWAINTKFVGRLIMKTLALATIPPPVSGVISLGVTPTIGLMEANWLRQCGRLEARGQACLGSEQSLVSWSSDTKQCALGGSFLRQGRTLITFFSLEK